MSDEDPPLLAVEGLRTHFPVKKGLLRREVARVRAVDGVTFAVDNGEVLGLVGESGSGKTTTALSILGLEEPTGGEIRFEGQPVDQMDESERRAFRRRVQLVVQNPNEAFNPRMRIGEIVAEPLLLNGMTDADRRRAIVEDILERIGLSGADADRFPHEFSGGEKQRIAIARALVVNPDLIVADEPTSALDGKVQAEVLDLLDRVRQDFDVGIIFISHDIELIRRFSDRIAIMYLGKLVERGPTEAVLDDPAHPYSRVLVESVPSLRPGVESGVEPLTDEVGDPANPPDGCRFHPRCPAIIPPESDELDPDEWERIARFRFGVATGEMPTVVVPGESDAETVRDGFDLPATTGDEAIDTAVSAAVDDVAGGDLAAASERLQKATETVCEREVPGDRTEGDRQVRCHRFDPKITTHPIPADDD